MFALIFRVPEGIFGLPLDDIELLMPAYPLASGVSHTPHFAGTFEKDGTTFSVFDLCSALFGRGSRRTFGTRYAILNSREDEKRAALEIEGVENIAEFDDGGGYDSSDGKFTVHRCRENDINVPVVRLGVVFPKGFSDA